MDNNKNIYVTDGQDLAEKVEELVESGVTDVTVNVNTLNYTRYQKSHDGLELHPVIDGDVYKRQVILIMSPMGFMHLGL